MKATKEIVKTTINTPKKKTVKALKSTILVSDKSPNPQLLTIEEDLNPTFSHIDITEEVSEIEEAEEMKLSTFPDECFSNLPSLLSRAVEKTNSNEDRDILLLGSITTLSACLPNISGNYDERELFANLFLFVTAKASAGKGRLSLCRKLVEPIHKELLQQLKDEKAIYKADLATLKQICRGGAEQVKPQEPPLRALIIPANSSATSVFQILNDNDGIGLLFETEGDTLAQAFKSEHGNYSDGLRKAFHHETISYSRRKENEFVELDKPRLSAVLSGTPRQVATLIPCAENGLFSRFMYYYMNIKPTWIDVFAGGSGQTLDAYFEVLGAEFQSFYKQLKASDPMRFEFTTGQKAEFNDYFEKTQKEQHCMLGDEYMATIRRLGVITFRIGMILTTLRRMDANDLKTPLICSDKDFQTAMAMVKVLVEHATFVFNQLPAERTLTVKGKTRKQLFMEALPAQFNRQGYLAVAEKMNIVSKTADKYVGQFKEAGLLSHIAHNLYCK